MFSDADLARLSHEEFRQRELLVGRPVEGVSTDSRTVAPGELFVALRGAQFDGHRFVADAFTRGAAAAVVDSRSDVHAYPPAPILVVRDTQIALGALAALHRSRFRCPVVAIAGSNGKTTTKDMITAVLASKMRVLSTQGNLNNHIGVPQTLFRLRKEHRVAVIELGTNHPGEMEALLRIARPTHGVVTNIGGEHLEFFGSLEGVAEEEGAVYRWLAQRRRGTAFVNADDPRVVALARPVRRTVTYGFTARRSAVRGLHLALDPGGNAHFAIAGTGLRRPVPVALRIAGRHNAWNALAAAAVGVTLHVPPDNIRTTLEGFEPANRRMKVLRAGGVTVIDDSYNANADSTLAALATLAAMRTGGKKIAALADMLELGESAAREHHRVGEEASRLGIDYVLTYGPLARGISNAARGPFVFHYDQKNMLAEYLSELVSPGDAVLVKGSRGMHMEDVVTFLTERLQRSSGTVSGRPEVS